MRANKASPPIRSPASLPVDCENQPYEAFTVEPVQPLSVRMSDIESLDGSRKSVFTYRFSSQKEELTANINAKLVELGYHPADDSVAAKVIRMTQQLRYKKDLLRKYPKNTLLHASTLALINARIYTLRLLRATNLSEFHRITAALGITDFRHPDPFEMFPKDPLTERKIAVREECYRARLSRLAELKVQLASTEKEFYERKQASLALLLKKLESVLKCPDEEKPEKARQMLRKLFNEVVNERRNEVLEAPRQDELWWYDWEARQRERYLEWMKMKELKQLKKKR